MHNKYHLQCIPFSQFYSCLIVDHCPPENGECLDGNSQNFKLFDPVFQFNLISIHFLSVIFSQTNILQHFIQVSYKNTIRLGRKDLKTR